MDDLRTQIKQAEAHGKVKPEHVFSILLSLVDKIEALSGPVVVAVAEPVVVVAAPEPEPEIVAAPEPEPEVEEEPEVVSPD